MGLWGGLPAVLNTSLPQGAMTGCGWGLESEDHDYHHLPSDFSSPLIEPRGEGKEFPPWDGSICYWAYGSVSEGVIKAGVPTGCDSSFYNDLKVWRNCALSFTTWSSFPNPTMLFLVRAFPFLLWKRKWTRIKLMVTCLCTRCLFMWCHLKFTFHCVG